MIKNIISLLSRPSSILQVDKHIRRLDSDLSRFEEELKQQRQQQQQQGNSEEGAIKYYCYKIWCIFKL